MSRTFNKDEAYFTIKEYKNGEFITTCGYKVDPFVTEILTAEEAEKWIGKKIKATGFFTGCLIAESFEEAE